MTDTNAAQKITIKPNQTWLNVDWAGVWQYRDLLVLMVQRDFTSKYKQTLLGPLWFIITPIINAGVYTFVFGRIMSVPTDGVPPMLFFLSSQLGWNYFSGVLGSTANSLAGNIGLFGKVYFPRLIPPLAMCGSCLMAFFVQLAVFLLVWIYYKFGSSYGAGLHLDTALFLLPVLIVQMAALGLGVGLILSALTAKYRDLAQLTGFLMQIWMYATPVIYPLSSIPARWRWAVNINPMTSIVELTRRIFVGVGSVTPRDYAVSLLLTTVILTFGVLFYQRMARTFVDTV
jgi:lipopolysaccharide transport system permease protein